MNGCSRCRKIGGTRRAARHKAASCEHDHPVAARRERLTLMDRGNADSTTSTDPARVAIVSARDLENHAVRRPSGTGPTWKVASSGPATTCDRQSKSEAKLSCGTL